MGAGSSTLWELVDQGNLQALKNSVAEHGTQSINLALDAYDTTPLLLASRRFRPKIVEWLLDNGADTTRQDDRGWTALHWASAAGDVGAAAVLLDRAADSSRRDVLGRLPRHLLAQAVCDADTSGLHERLLESELNAQAEASHSLAVPGTVFAGGPEARIVIEVRAPEFHSESDYVQLYVERGLKGELNTEGPTPAAALSALANNLMPRYGSYRYVAKGRRSVVVFDSSMFEVGQTMRAVYVRADGAVILASEIFRTEQAPPPPEPEEEPEWEKFKSKSSGKVYFVNTQTGESIDELPEGATYASYDTDDSEEQGAEAGAGGDDTALRQELGGLKVSELKKRARGAGMGLEALDACDDTDDPKAAVIEALLHHMANPPPTPEPEPEPERPAVESTPEQAEFRKNLSEFRSIAMDMGALSVGEGDAGVLWDGEEEAGLVWSHATMELSVSPPTPHAQLVTAAGLSCIRSTSLREGLCGAGGRGERRRRRRLGLAGEWVDRGSRRAGGSCHGPVRQMVPGPQARIPSAVGERRRRGRSSGGGGWAQGGGPATLVRQARCCAEGARGAGGAGASSVGGGLGDGGVAADGARCAGGGQAAPGLPLPARAEEVHVRTPLLAHSDAAQKTVKTGSDWL